MSRLSPRRRLTGLVLSTALLAGGLASTAAAYPHPPASPTGWTTGRTTGGSPATGTSPPKGSWVTLLTGDRVYVEGKRIALDPAPGRERIGFSQYERDGHQYVVPNDAVGLVSSNRVDQRLSDVTGLVESGYDDAHVTELPTIISYDAGAAPKVRSADGPGSPGRCPPSAPPRSRSARPRPATSGST